MADNIARPGPSSVPPPVQHQQFPGHINNNVTQHNNHPANNKSSDNKEKEEEVNSQPIDDSKSQTDSPVGKGSPAVSNRISLIQSSMDAVKGSFEKLTNFRRCVDSNNHPVRQSLCLHITNLDG